MYINVYYLSARTGGLFVDFRKKIVRYTAAFAASILCIAPVSRLYTLSAGDEYSYYGGGYAATGQISGVGYTTELYDASNGLPTSDAMFLMGAHDGHVWVGGYSGVFRYDGTVFEKLDPSEGFTNARGFFEDSSGRIWVGTNDNGVVVTDGNENVHITYKEGLPSSSIRVFAEDKNGNVFIGTTTGICYADKELRLHSIGDKTIAKERIIRLDTDSEGRVYGQTSSGIIFAIDKRTVSAVYQSDELGMAKITTIMADPHNAGKVYIGTENSEVYYGEFGSSAKDMELISVPELNGSVHWINHDCGKVWISSATACGYLDDEKRFHKLDDLPLHSGIEMQDSDYQGNIWIASSTQGVTKLVTNNFEDITSSSGLTEEVSNAVFFYGDDLYIGTDTGIQIIGKDGKKAENALTDYLKGTKIRCFVKDSEGNLWVATYTNEMGLICYTANGDIKSYTTENGMPSNQIRSVSEGEDGSIYAGTNGGLAVISNGKVSYTAGREDGISNTVFLTVTKTDDGRYLAGTDGGGIYVISNDSISSIGRDEGLTSEVIMRIIKDDANGVFWIVTSNSIQYLKNGILKEVTTFPYNNNYDIYFDKSGKAWVLSSHGIYVVDTEDMLNDTVKDYSIYTIENGLPYAITSNSHSVTDDSGNLYIPGRNGVIRVNIDNYREGKERFLTGVRAVYCDDERIYPDKNGVYTIPPSRGRVQITASVMDYTMINPYISVYLEDGPDSGITVPRSQLSSLEYTNLPYGKYKLHIQVIDSKTGAVLQDNTYKIIKQASFFELLYVRILIAVLIAAIISLIVWAIMRSTIIARQYNEIRQAKNDAERANTAKSRFLANISHEIRTPISTIMGMNEMIMREDATDVPKEYFMSIMNYSFDIRSSSELLLGMIDDLLDISKIESGKMHLIEQEYDLQEMLRSVISMIRIRSTAKGLNFEISADEMLPRRMYGDISKIKQIVLNFLTNAVKYTAVGGFVLNITMDERKNDSAIISFSVKDTGIGIKAEDIDKVFTAYERLDEQLSSGIQGTGLGLDISKRYAELMGGTLRCESKYNEGSEFILTLPQKIVDSTPIGTFSEYAIDVVKGPYLPQFIAPDADILVIDDDPMSLDLMKGLLQPTRVFVTTSQRGEDALEKIKDTHFDVVFLDLIMAGMNGIEIIEKIRKTDKDLPVYVLTANAAEDENYYKNIGFTGLLLKPVDGDKLEKTIMKHLPEEMMEHPKQERENAEPKELPSDMLWLNETEGISVKDGIKNSGGISGFLFSLELFRDTIDENISIIRETYISGNIKLFALKIHAIRVSAHIIGAYGLAEYAGKLESACDKHDIEFINSHIDVLISEYEIYKERLKRLKRNEE